jgi:hypothetical protein
MGNRHLCHAAHQKNCDDSADEIAEEHGRTCESDGETGTKEEARTDGPSNGDH